MFFRLIFLLLKIALAVFVVFAVLLVFIQDGMIYFPRVYEEVQLAGFEATGGVELAFETKEGKQVAFYLPPNETPEALPASLWLICGGNGSLALDYLDVAVRAGRDQAYLFVDYPDYGKCEGRPSPDTAAANVEGAVNALAEHLGSTKEVLAPRFSAFGHSLGAAVVLRAAADMGMRRVVVVAPFTSMMDFARKQVGFPLCQVLRHRFDNRTSLRAIGEAGGKVTVFHGSADAEVPVAHSRDLAALFPETIEYHEIPDGDHNGIVEQIGGRIAEAMRAGSVSSE